MKYYNYELDKINRQRKGKINDLSSAVSELLDIYKLKDRFQEMSILNAWDEVMGSTVSKRTQHIYIKDLTLFVKLESASLKHELMMAKSRILEKLNEHLGQKSVEEIIFS